MEMDSHKKEYCIQYKERSPVTRGVNEMFTTTRLIGEPASAKGLKSFTIFMSVCT